MRPVLLEMTGFGSFRDHAVIDFANADFFVLTGPTGAGKSTVIDAFTFALYGSVHRWDDAKIVKYALAPTANQADVKLVFDVGPHRYLVTRQVRRTATTFPHKSRLERLLDPTALPAPGGGDTTSLAADSETAHAVEQLLGLTFEQFCTCVLLPQGDFADFLHASGKDRQQILAKLLDAERYDRIARAANARAAAAGQRAEVLTEELTGYADVTPEAIAAAAARVATLDVLDTAVTTTLLPVLAAAQTEVDTAKGEQERLEAEAAQLAAVTVPADVDALDARHAVAVTAKAQADSADTAAQAADTAAREAVAAAPLRGPLQDVRRWHAERLQLTADRPAALARRTTAAAASNTATKAAAGGEVALEEARAARDSAAASASKAIEDVARERTRVARLSALRVPAGVGDLDDRATAAQTTLVVARAALVTAEAAEVETAAALVAAPDRGHLQRRLDAVVTLTQLTADAATHEQAVDAARAAVATADAAVDAAAGVAAHAAQVILELQLTDQAGHLRSHLSTGAPCPVCEQVVTKVPALTSAPKLTRAAAVNVSAQGDLDRTQTAATEARTQVARAEAVLEAVTSRIDELQITVSATLPAGAPTPTPMDRRGRLASDATSLTDPAALRTQLDDIDRLTAAAGAARTRLRESRQIVDGAAATVDRLNVELAEARSSLRAARDPLVTDGAPAVDDTSLRSAWTRLTDWVSGAAETAGRELAEAVAQQKATSTGARGAQAGFVTADAAVAARRAALTAAAAEQAAADTDLTNLEARLAAVAELLTGAVTDTRARALLAIRDAAEAAASTADAVLRGTRAARSAAAEVVADAAREQAAAARALGAARDALVALGAPELPIDDLLGGWQLLVAWASKQGRRRGTAAVAAKGQVTAARGRLDRAEQALASAFTDAGVDAPTSDLDGSGAAGERAAVIVARVRSQAHGEHARLLERATTTDRMRTSRTVAQTAQRVARDLGSLLAVNRFGRWLTMAALDGLLVEASANMFELSDGQYELTHTDGNLFVIDHTDADTQRVVKTLSGGETFQASLSLALALSSQLAARSMGSGNRLDSIFLDEGFGTLDAGTLDAVAGALENLAHRDRMVGVITHVPALAERIPVRFLVSRNERTSTVVREDL